MTSKDLSYQYSFNLWKHLSSIPPTFFLLSAPFLYHVLQNWCNCKSCHRKGQQGFASSPDELNEAFKRFVNLVDASRVSENFYENWRVMATTLIDPESIKASVKQDPSMASVVSIVMNFMGLPASPSTIIEDLDRAAKERRHMDFDSETFLKNVFNVIDVDNSGAIDHAELKQMMKHLNLFTSQIDRRQRYNDVAVEKLFDEMDTNQDGTISQSEFILWWKSTFIVEETQ